MQRRKFLIGAGAASTGGALMLGSGAFSRVESDRAVEIQVAEDPDAYVGLDECDTAHGDNYVEIDEKGHLFVDISENPNDGHGVNSNSRTWFHNVFEICNQGKEDACVWIEKDDDWPIVDEGPYEDEPRVDFYLEDDDEQSILGAENAHEIELGDCYCIGIKTITHGIDANDEEALLDAVGDEITLVADVECPEDPGECIEPDPTDWCIDPDPEDPDAGGPMALLGIDSEDGGIGGHGPIDSYVQVVEEGILAEVSNDGDGILVIGEEEKDFDTEVNTFWDEIGDQTGRDVDYVGGAGGIGEVSFDGYEMLAVVSAEGAMGGITPPTDVEESEGLTDAENEALIGRTSDVATFVSDGGGLFGSSQGHIGGGTILTNPWGYIGGLNSFETTVGLSYNEICPTDEGADLGLGDPNNCDSPLDVCCWHDVFTEHPDFLDVLAEHDDGGLFPPPEYGEPAVLGGSDVVPPVAVDICVSGDANVEFGTSQTYNVDVTNIGAEVEDVVFDWEVSGNGGSVSFDLPDDDPFDLEEDFDETWEDAIEVTCEGSGEFDITLWLEEDGNGDEVATLDDVTIECIEDPPGVCEE